MLSCIRGQDKIFQRTLGEQKPCAEPLHWSRFVIREEAEGGTLLFNALNRILVFCDRPEAALADPAALPREDAEKLRSWHFLVPESRDEMRFADQMNSVLRLFHSGEEKKRRRSFTIYTTTACNARCPYCFEAGCRTVTMTRETAERAVDFMIAAARGEELRMSWFGGEPLVNAPVIDYICGRLREQGLAYRSTIITNGYLWTPEMIRRAAEDWLLKNAQITLDGTEQIYNEIKNYKSAVGSPYRRVLDNIGGLLDAGIRVSVRMNLSVENAEDLLKLVSELQERFGGREGFRIYTHLLFDYLLSSENRPLAEYTAPLEAYRKLSLRIEQLGYGKSLRTFDRWVNHCMADSDGSYVITPDGNLTLCEHFFDEHIVGDLTNGVTDREELLAWKERKGKTQLCESCPLYPTCIRLIKCPDEPSNCSELQREIILLDLRCAMRSTCKNREKLNETSQDNEQDEEEEHR